MFLICLQIIEIVKLIIYNRFKFKLLLIMPIKTDLCDDYFIINNAFLSVLFIHTKNNKKYCSRDELSAFIIVKSISWSELYPWYRHASKRKGCRGSNKEEERETMTTDDDEKRSWIEGIRKLSQRWKDRRPSRHGVDSRETIRK